MMRPAPDLTHPSITDRPTAPMPNTAHEEPASTLAVFCTAPQPVASPHPSRLTLSSGASPRILATLSSCSTVYCEKVDVPM